MMQTNAFSDAHGLAYTSAYDLVRGLAKRVRTGDLVLDEDGNIPNLFEYTLGLKDHKEFI